MSRYFERRTYVDPNDEEAQYLKERGLLKFPPPRYSQIFILCDAGEARCEEWLGRLRSSLGSLCLAVFHLRNGQILFFNSDEPASITLQRSAQLLNRFDGWVIVDSDGASLSAIGQDESAWEQIELSQLRYQNDRDGKG
jgi:hypothetical protein